MGGSTQTTSNSYDPVSSTMAAYTALTSNQRSQEAWDFYKSDYMPYDLQAMRANTELMGVQKDLALQQLNQAKELDPIRTQATKAGLQEALYDIEANRPVRDALRKNQLNELSWSAPVAEKFYAEALRGIDPQYEQKMGMATSDVALAYENSMADVGREMARMGVDPTSGRGVSALSGIGMQRAKDTAYARTAARENERARVEDVNFARLQAGTQMRQHATGGQWAPDYGTAALGAMPFIQGPQQFTPTSNPLNASTQYQGLAQQGWNSLSNRVMSSTTTKDDGGAGIMSSVAGIGGMALGGYLSK